MKKELHIRIPREILNGNIQILYSQSLSFTFINYKTVSYTLWTMQNQISVACCDVTYYRRTAEGELEAAREHTC